MLTVSPDKKLAYFLIQSMTKKSKGEVVLKGDVSPQMSLMKIDIESKKSKIIAREISFAATVKWSRKGDMVAFIGERKLIFGR